MKRIWSGSSAHQAICRKANRSGHHLITHVMSITLITFIIAGLVPSFAQGRSEGIQLEALKASQIEKSTPLMPSVSGINLTQDEATWRPTGVRPRAKDVLETLKVFEHWANASSSIFRHLDSYLRPRLEALPNELPGRVSERCVASLNHVLQGLIKMERWAYRMTDAIGRFPSSGFFDGTLSELGDFDECVEVQVPPLKGASSGHALESGVGQYCLIKMQMPLIDKPGFLAFDKPVIDPNQSHVLRGTVWARLLKYSNAFWKAEGFRLGLCVPSHCQPAEVQDILNHMLKSLTKLTFVIEPEVGCSTKTEPVKWSTAQEWALFIVKSMTYLVIAGTLIDLLSKSFYLPESLYLKFARCFSAIEHTSKIFTIPAQEDLDQNPLSCVAGLRVLTSSLIVVGHVYEMCGAFRLSYLIRRPADFLASLHTKTHYGVLYVILFQVESFFFLTGLILATLVIPMIEKSRGRFNYVMYVIHRWLRSTPSVAAIICVYLLMPTLRLGSDIGQGPVFKEEINYWVKPCEDHWWTNLLYINNFYELKDNCVLQTWFLSADFQIYLISPLILLALYYSVKFGLALLVLGGAAAMYTCFYYAYALALPPTYLPPSAIDLDIVDHFVRNAYFPFYQHIAPHFMGLFVGWILVKYRSQIKLPGIIIWAGWIFVSATTYAISRPVYLWTRPEAEPSLFSTSVFVAVYPLVWSWITAWITFLCATGHGGVLQRFLSWRYLAPFARLSFALYLTNFVPVKLRAASIKYTYPMDDFAMVATGLLCLVISYILAYLLCIIFEAPCAALEKMLISALGHDDALRGGKTKRSGDATETKGGASGLSENENRPKTE